MNKRGLIALTAVICTSLFFVIGCKDDDDEDYAYLNGSVQFHLDYYLAPWTTVTLEPSGVSHPDGGELTYVWTVTPEIGDEYKDTTFTFTYTFGDTLQTYTVECMARADDYMPSTTTYTTMIVVGGLDGTGSITDSVGNSIVNLAQMGYIVDDREEEEKIYYYTGFNGYDWLIQNLEYRGGDNSIGIAYLDLDVTNDVFGTFYTYDEALKVCPDGWKLPTAEEWENCVTFDSGSLMANVYFNKIKMWEFWPAVTISNNSFFTAMPVGEANVVGKTFAGFRSRAVFWTATEYDSERAVVKYFMDDQDMIYEAAVDKASFGANVRCIRPGKSDIPF